MDLEKSASRSVVKGGFSGQCCVIKDSLSTNLALSVSEHEKISITSVYEVQESIIVSCLYDRVFLCDVCLQRKKCYEQGEVD